VAQFATVAFPTSLPMALQSLRCADLSTTTDLEFPRHRGLNPVGPARTISVAFWMRTPASWSGVYVSVMSAPASGTARVELKVKTTHIALTFEQMGAGGLAEDFECQVGVNLAASTWYHVALVAAGSRKREVYINGELRCSAVLASYESNAAGSSTLTIRSGSGMLIDEFYATGNLIWNAHVRALFASGTVEALALCGNGVIDAGEACDDGNFDDADGCRIDCTVDSTLKAWIKSGAGDDASPGGVNFATLFDGAVAGPGLSGESDAAIVFSTTLNQNPAPRVEIPAVTTMIGATPLHRWTLAFWVYFQPAITASTILPYMEYAGDGPFGLFFVGCNSNTCDHVEIRPLSITGSLSSANRIYPLGRLDGIGLGPAGANIVKGAWIHVAVVTEYQRDAAFVNRMHNLYINGVRVSSSYGFGCNNCAGPSRTANFGAAAGYQFYGSLSDIRMFHRAFGSGQIKDLFLSSLRVGGVEYPRDCSDIMELAARRQGFEPIAADPSASRFYTVYPFAPADITRSTQVFCDMSSRGGGWTLVMHSKDGYLCGGDLSVPCGDYEPAGQEGGSAHIQYASKIMALSGEALVTWGGSAPSTGVATESDSAMIFSTHLMMEPGPLLASARAGVSCTSLTDPSPTWRPLLWSRCDTGINQVPSSTIFTSEAQWFTGSDFSVCFGTAYGFVRRGATNVCDDTTASAASGFAAIFWSQPNMPSLPACRGIKGASTFVPAYSQLWVRSMVSVDRQTAESETTVAA
jgi:cysteine-rich repeat protein